MLPQVHVGDAKLVAAPMTTETLAESDCVVIVTDHRAFDCEMIARESPLIVDVHNALRDFRQSRWNGVTL